jgi:hypothetical protein
MEAQFAELLRLMQTQMLEQQKQQALLQSQLLEQQKLQQELHKLLQDHHKEDLRLQQQHIQEQNLQQIQVLKDIIQGRSTIATNETVPQVAAISPAHTVATFPEFNEKEQWEIYFTASQPFS